MRVFVAGATGAMGVPLVKRLVAEGHQVTGLTRSESKRALLEGLGATPVVADVFDRERLGAVLREARPEVVVHLLTRLPCQVHRRLCLGARLRRDVGAYSVFPTTSPECSPAGKAGAAPAWRSAALSVPTLGPCRPMTYPR